MFTCQKTKKQNQLHLINAKHQYIMMNDPEKNNEELVKELQELRQKHNSLKALYDKNLSENKLAEKKFGESENKFNLMFENAPLSYQSLDGNTRLIDVNPAWLKTMGYGQGRANRLLF